MKTEDFLVTTWVGKHSWKRVWDPAEPLELEHPSVYTLRMSDTGPEVIGFDGKVVEVDISQARSGSVFKLPKSAKTGREIEVVLEKLSPIRPAFLPVYWLLGDDPGQGDHFLSEGIREHLTGFGPLKAGHCAKVEGCPVFKMTATGAGYEITSFQKDLRFKVMGEKSQAVEPGAVIKLSGKSVANGAFIWGSYWWRINRHAEPELLPSEEFEDEASFQETIPLSWISRITVSLFLSVIIILRVFNSLEEGLLEKEKKLVKQEVQVELKKPKIIPKIEVSKVAVIPPPPPPPKKPEPPKVIKKEPPKIVKKDPPKKIPPPPKLVKKEPPKKPEPPVKVVKKEPPKPAPPVQQVPKPVVVQQPVKRIPEPHKVAQVPNPSAVQAQQKANLAKSLNFLSTAPAKNIAALAKIPNGQFNAKYDTSGNGALAGSKNGGASALNRLASNAGTGDGLIATKGARNVASAVGLQGSRGKGLNEVQGKVSLSALYGSGSGESLGTSLGGQNLSVTGPGRLSDALVQKTLAKFLSKFQYCYEKALLTDSSLAGAVMMQWTINIGGGVSGPQVVKSQLNNKGMHDCLARELSAIVFPSPTGGAVAIKYPFNFSSSGI